MDWERWVLPATLLLAVGLVVTGVVLDQPQDVLAKAIRICLECIGIG
ncbi:MAG: thioredoxin [Coriobacteriales bacterium]|nr:thioredoxin [Coriobacteriales bacterium]MBQ6585515.1 thioredoxin [Coriobacteriales bacterium]